MLSKILVTTVLAAGVMLAATAARAQDAAELEVFDLTTKKHLNVRAGGSMDSAVIAGLVMGEKVKNMGCKDGWCQIETAKGVKGYSSAKFLKASAMAAAAAPAAKPKFAMGKLKCERNNGSPAAECTYGVMRIGTGARLQVIWPDASKRMFGMFGPAVTSAAGDVRAAKMTDGSFDVTLTPKGAASEHYIVPAEAF
jgi:uncharacterized protein YgiM (DUF1202 family)